MTAHPLTLGIDFGTSGCRAAAVDADGNTVAWASEPLPPSRGTPPCQEQQPEEWWRGLGRLLHTLLAQVPAGDIRSLAVNGTSASILFTDTAGTPLWPALMYNDGRGTGKAAELAPLIPADSGAQGGGSALARALWWLEQLPELAPAHLCHQADWISGRLLGHFSHSDENNCLKLGYDPVQRQWPAWLAGLPGGQRLMELLPRVVPPGSHLGEIQPRVAAELGLAEGTRIAAGTTDSVAAFMATGAEHPGDAVTSLGSTLVIKILSPQPVFDAASGVYSHRLGDAWLAGGASNSGGAVLLQFFSEQQIHDLTGLLQPQQPTGLDYYPLLWQGERFPVNDAQLVPRLAPRPDDERVFFQAILEGIAGIEAKGYQRLEQLGAPTLQRVFTVGGGAVNEGWQRIRAQRLGVPVVKAQHDEAAFGTALLARKAL